MHTRYVPERMSLSGVPELNGVVPTAAYQLVLGFRVEAGAEHPGFVAIHHIRRNAAFQDKHHSTGYFLSFVSLLRDINIVIVTHNGETSPKEKERERGKLSLVIRQMTASSFLDFILLSRSSPAVKRPLSLLHFLVVQIQVRVVADCDEFRQVWVVSQTERLPSLPYRVETLLAWVMPTLHATAGIYVNKRIDRSQHCSRNEFRTEDVLTSRCYAVRDWVRPAHRPTLDSGDRCRILHHLDVAQGQRVFAGCELVELQVSVRQSRDQKLVVFGVADAKHLSVGLPTNCSLCDLFRAKATLIL